jgi:hypothetical protein
MQKAAAVFLLLLMVFPVLLAAQDDSPEIDPDWDWDFFDDLYTRGDQTFNITLGVIFPTIFNDSDGESFRSKFTPPVGGTGSLAYNYYFTSSIFIGAEAGMIFIHTLGGNTLFTIPLGVRGGYQFNIWRLEFPLALTFGMVWHRLLDAAYYGLYIKGGGSVFYRASYTWSFGLNTNWYWFPQWVRDDKGKNVYGNMLNLTLTARHHF